MADVQTTTTSTKKQKTTKAAQRQIDAEEQQAASQQKKRKISTVEEEMVEKKEVAASEEPAQTTTEEGAQAMDETPKEKKPRRPSSINYSKNRVKRYLVVDKNGIEILNANGHRRIFTGKSPFDAAKKYARSLKNSGVALSAETKSEIVDENGRVVIFTSEEGTISADVKSHPEGKVCVARFFLLNISSVLNDQEKEANKKAHADKQKLPHSIRNILTKTRGRMYAFESEYDPSKKIFITPPISRTDATKKGTIVAGSPPKDVAALEEAAQKSIFFDPNPNSGIVLGSRVAMDIGLKCVDTKRVFRAHPNMKLNKEDSENEKIYMKIRSDIRRRKMAENKAKNEEGAGAAAASSAVDDFEDADNENDVVDDGAEEEEEEEQVEEEEEIVPVKKTKKAAPKKTASENGPAKKKARSSAADKKAADVAAALSSGEEEEEGPSKAASEPEQPAAAKKNTKTAKQTKTTAKKTKAAAAANPEKAPVEDTAAAMQVDEVPKKKTAGRKPKAPANAGTANNDSTLVA